MWINVIRTRRWGRENKVNKENYTKCGATSLGREDGGEGGGVRGVTCFK